MTFHGEPPHFVVLPYFAKGHFIPMVDMAQLIAKRGVTVTLLATPFMANAIKSVIDRTTIRVSHLRLPSAEAGLPEGCEDPDTLTLPENMFNLLKAIAILRGQVEELLQELDPAPTCLMTDGCFSWATDLTRRMCIPRLVYHYSSCFTEVCSRMLAAKEDFEGASSNMEYVEVPGIPDRIVITKAQLKGVVVETPPFFLKAQKEIRDATDEAYGLVANTFEELEPEYVQLLEQSTGQKLWCIGPVSSCNNDGADKAERGKKASIDQDQCLKWLDSHEPGSVVYVCFGSASEISTSQLIELGLGLEKSNRPFVWVIRGVSDKMKAWLREVKFEERVDGRGLVVQGWAPQVLVLSHPSVGGFITHCGWNSTLEAVTAGVPMITWPMFADHFTIQRFILNVIKTGVPAGVEVPIVFGFLNEGAAGLRVKSEYLKSAIDELMDGGEEGRERRERARKLGQMAGGAVEEGGSSYDNLTRLIQDVILQKAKLCGDTNGFSNFSSVSFS